VTALSSGSNNVGVGRNAMQGLTTGTSNVGIGVQALIVVMVVVMWELAIIVSQH